MGTLPRDVLPLENVTVPVGAFPQLLPLIFAGRLTLLPRVIVAPTGNIAIVVDACVIVKVAADEVLALKLASPL
jgi:hypothetical protein